METKRLELSTVGTTAAPSHPFSPLQCGSTFLITVSIKRTGFFWEWDEYFSKTVLQHESSPFLSSDENQAYVASGRTAFSRHAAAAQARVILVLGLLLVG